MMATNIASTTAAITLTGGSLPPLPLSSMETTSPGVESVGRVFSLGVEESGTILVVDEATGSKVMGSSEVGSLATEVVAGGVIGHGGGVGKI